MNTEEKVKEIETILGQKIGRKRFRLTHSNRVKGRSLHRARRAIKDELFTFYFEVKGDDVTKVYDTFKLFGMEHKIVTSRSSYDQDTHYAYIINGEFEDASLEQFMS